MLDPVGEIVRTLRAQFDAEKAQAQRGSRFADEAHWTASNETIEAMLLEHFATTQEPELQRLWTLHDILLEHDESRQPDNAKDLLNRGYPVTDDEVIAAWRAYVADAADPAAARAMVYDIVLIARAMDGDDGERIDPSLTYQIGEQLNAAADILKERRASARAN